MKIMYATTVNKHSEGANFNSAFQFKSLKRQVPRKGIQGYSHAH